MEWKKMEVKMDSTEDEARAMAMVDGPLLPPIARIRQGFHFPTD